MKWYLICQLPWVTGAALPLLAPDSSTLSPCSGEWVSCCRQLWRQCCWTEGEEAWGGGVESGALFLMELRTVSWGDSRQFWPQNNVFLVVPNHSGLSRTTSLSCVYNLVPLNWLRSNLPCGESVKATVRLLLLNHFSCVTFWEIGPSGIHIKYVHCQKYRIFLSWQVENFGLHPQTCAEELT